METWVTTQDLCGLASLPQTLRGINKKAQRENWVKRQRAGVKGKTFEYEITSLPQEVQAEYLLKTSANKPAKTNTEKQAEQVMSESAWNVLSSATFAQEAKAQRRFDAVLKLKTLLELSMPLMQAIDQV
ncbi:transposase, partial [Gallibacterium salpingitidis]